MIKYKRSGDHYLHPTKETKGKIIEHNGEFIFGEGEASNHFHSVKVKDKNDLIIRQDENGNYYFELLSDGELWHTTGKYSNQIADHKPIPIKKGKYYQVHERELDFASGIARNVID